MKLIGKIAALALSVATTCAAGDVVKSLAGEWRVTGDALSGVVHLPGTLADAKLGTHKTAADWEKDTNRASKGALTREYQYIGKAVYEREITLTEEEAREAGAEDDAEFLANPLLDTFQMRPLLQKRMVLLSSGEMRRYQLFKYQCST